MVDDHDDERDDDRDRERGERDLPESIRKRLEAMVPDLVKRTVSAGVGALFATEENIRKLAKDLPGAGDVAGYLATTADSTKDKVLEIIAREVREFLATVNLGEEIAKMLTALSFEVKTEIRFIPNSERYAGVEPDVKAAVRVKRNERRARRRETTEPDRPAGETGGEDGERPRRRFWRRGSGPGGEGGTGNGGSEPTGGGGETDE
jgi:hypothetical protein